MTRTFLLPAVLLGLAWGQPAQAFDSRAEAEVTCKPGNRAMVYACDIQLSDRRTGAPLRGLDVTVGATMPSMPMAHNVRPVTARPGFHAGEYTAVLELEMYGVWALQIDLAGPVRDRVVTTLDFQPAEGTQGHSGQHRH